MPTPVSPTPIVSYSGGLPDPSDPATYGTRGRALWAWEVGDLYSGMNALGASAYTNALAAVEAADAAAMTAGAAMWNAATGYTTGQNAISPSDMQTYRRNSPGGVDATDPAASALWTLVGELFVRSSGGTIDGEVSVESGGYITASANMGNLPSNSSALALTAPILKNKAANANTYVGAVSSGTGSGAGFFAKHAASNQWGAFTVKSDGVYIDSGWSNSAGSAGPIKFLFKGVQKAAISAIGVLEGYGVRGRQGTGGATLGSAVNFYWTGSALEVWVDTTRIGTMNITP